jgi:hypothetical protein
MLDKLIKEKMLYQNIEVSSTRCQNELEKQLASLNNWVVDLHKKMDMKDQ